MPTTPPNQQTPVPEPITTPDQPLTRDKTFYLALLAIVISVVGTGISMVETGILRDQQ